MIAHGRVRGVAGGLLLADLPGARIGEGVSLARDPLRRGVVRSLRGDGRVAIALCDASAGIGVGETICARDGSDRLPVGMALLGRALDARGVALDGEASPRGCRGAIACAPPDPAQRVPVVRPLWTGVRVIDGLLTLGAGARVGIFGAPGAGKSTLLEGIVAGVRADAVVVGLIGERGREAERWIARRDARTTIVCATGDRAPAERVAAAQYAFAQASALRARGLDVLLVLDSLARLAFALRELAVADGEATGRGGYPASVFAELARIVEIAGPIRAGSMTLLATVLSDGDERDPVSESARSLLDGHLALDGERARAGFFPAIDVLASASRTMGAVTSEEHRRAAATIRAALAWLARTADARALGLLPESPERRYADAEPAIAAFLRQDGAASEHRDTLGRLAQLADTLEEPHEHR